MTPAKPHGDALERLEKWCCEIGRQVDICFTKKGWLCLVHTKPLNDPKGTSYARRAETLSAAIHAALDEAEK